MFKQGRSTVAARATLTSGRWRCWKGKRTGGRRSFDPRIRGTDGSRYRASAVCSPFSQYPLSVIATAGGCATASCGYHGQARS